MATWVGETVGMRSATCRRINRRAIAAYGSYAIPLGVTDTDEYTSATRDFVAEFQRRRNAGDLKAGLKRAPIRTDGVADWSTKDRMGGVLLTIPIPGSTKRKIPVMTVPGTVSWWNDGPPAWTAWKCDPGRYRQQGIGFSTDAFMMGDAAHSYIDACNEGVPELLRQSDLDRGPQWWIGYSMGADIVAQALRRLPEDRRADIVGVITFGSPARPPGPTKLGPDPGGAGIAGVYTPEWARGREWSFALPGDMYPEAVGLLPTLYQILVRLEASPEFALYLFQLLLSNMGGPLLGLVSAMIPGAGALSGITGLIGIGGGSPAGGDLLGGLLGGGGLGGLFGGQTGTVGGIGAGAPQINLLAMVINIPAIIQTIIAALKFVMTNAHYHYHDQPVFDGMTGVDRAAAIINAA